MVDNIEIGDGVVIGAQAGVTNSVRPGKQMLGSPAIEHKDALRVMVGSMRLPKLIGEFKKLSARVEKLETAKDDSKSGGR
jgi:UDP-3-O-[3-hydroxymyristoyl] glucosamine N-acyltransferase